MAASGEQETCPQTLYSHTHSGTTVQSDGVSSPGVTCRASCSASGASFCTVDALLTHMSIEEAKQAEETCQQMQAELVGLSSRGMYLVA